MAILFKNCYAYRFKKPAKNNCILPWFSPKKIETAKIINKIEASENSYSKLHTLENAELFEEITRAISERVTFENENRDSTDGIFDVLGEIADSVQEDFEGLVGISSDQKTFYKSVNKNIYAAIKRESRHCRKNQKNT